MNSYYRNPYLYKLNIWFTISSDDERVIRRILNRIEKEIIKDYLVFDTITENKIEGHIITLHCDDNIKWINYRILNEIVGGFLPGEFSYKTL